jgi:hypothetical protein
MKLSLPSFVYILITVIGFIRAIQLYYSSTRDLYEANKKDVWYSRQNAKTVPAELTNVAYLNYTRIDNSPDKIFYFIQVQFTKKNSRKGLNMLTMTENRSLTCIYPNSNLKVIPFTFYTFFNLHYQLSSKEIWNIEFDIYKFFLPENFS